MVSTPKVRSELLVSGFCNQNYDDTIPYDINALVQSFYDEYFYWTIQGNKMKEFINANNGDVMYPSSTFKIKEIEFECTLCPNGWEPKNKGKSELWIELKNVP